MPHPPTPAFDDEPAACRDFRRLMRDITAWYTAPDPDTFWDLESLAVRHPTIERDQIGAVLDATGTVFFALLQRHAPPRRRHRGAE
jgi:hypothetical protein